jgi:hypothetical protein
MESEKSTLSVFLTLCKLTLCKSTLCKLTLCKLTLWKSTLWKLTLWKSTLCKSKLCKLTLWKSTLCKLTLWKLTFWKLTFWKSTLPTQRPPEAVPSFKLSHVSTLSGSKGRINCGNESTLPCQTVANIRGLCFYIGKHLRCSISSIHVYVFR